METTMTDFALLAVVTRGDVHESHHLGDLVVADAGGKPLWAAGNPLRVAYFRSAQKPLTALAVVQSGAAERFALTDTELSVCCASHSGSRMHVTTVAGILDKLGLDERALQCGVHDPGDSEERLRLSRAGERPSPLHNNCSGKHAGMLASTLALGAPVATYLDRDHPLQQLISRNVALMSGVPEAGLQYGVDGCGAPVIALPLVAMATAYARLANPDELPDDLRAAATRIMAAMAIAPDMVSAPGAFNSELLAAGDGRIVAKGGAEGAFLVGLHDPRRPGLAMKIADGSGRAIPPVTLAALQALGGLSASAVSRLERFARPPIHNCHSVHVGDIIATLELEDLRHA
jgi:L-asparaginase II